MIISRLTASATVFAIAATAAVFQLAVPAAQNTAAAQAQPAVQQLERVVVTGKATPATAARL